MDFGARELIDLRRQRLNMLAELRQRFVRGDVGDDAAQRGDRLLELGHRPGAFSGADDGVEPCAEATDGVIEPRQLFGGRQGPQRVLNVAQGAFDATERRIVAALVTTVVDALRQQPDVAFDGFDSLTRHRFGDGAADIGQFIAERCNGMVDPRGLVQGSDPAGDCRKLVFDRRHLAGRRRLGHHRYRGRRIRRRCSLGFQFALSGEDFCDRGIERRWAAG